jgi:sulfite exporter TauE/SafE
MEFLTSLLEASTFPLSTAFILGLMTAVSPCPLATNITAIGFIGKDIENRNKVFYNGLFYTLGRALAYTLLAAILMFGADKFKVSGFFQQYGERFIGPLLIVVGLLMLDVLKVQFPPLLSLSGRMHKKGIGSYWDVLLLGVVFALAFCPYSGVLYFGMLIPMTVSSSEGILLPVVFAIATGIPVIVFAWLLAYSISGVGNLYKKIKVFEVWFRRIIAVLFLAVGGYYTFIMFCH